MSYWEIGREISPLYPWLNLNFSMITKSIPKYWEMDCPLFMDEVYFNRFRSVSPSFTSINRRFQVHEKRSFYLEGEKKVLLEEK